MGCSPSTTSKNGFTETSFFSQYSKYGFCAAFTAGTAAPSSPRYLLPSSDPSHVSTLPMASCLSDAALPATTTPFVTDTRPAGPDGIGATPHSKPASSATFLRL